MFGMLNKLMGAETTQTKRSLKKQLITTFLAVGLLPMILIGSISLYLSNTMAHTKISAGFSSLTANKKVSIENYATTISNQIITAAQDPNLSINLKKTIQGYEQIVGSIGIQDENVEKKISELRQELSSYYNNQFLPTYKESNDGESIDTRSLLNALSNEAVILQHAYIQKNPAALGNKHEMYRSALESSYDSSHDLVHQQFKIFLEKFGYYDIFLVDTKGNVVYSVYKELDYATNILNGAYANTGLGNAFQESMRLNSSAEYALIDYEQYAPSYDAPASFIASPIFEGSERIGSLIFQMPIDIISSVMSERSGLGETGEAYLVGPDGYLRSNSTKYPDEYSVVNSFKKDLQANSESMELALSGKKGILKGKNYKGDVVLSGYVPIQFGSLKWGMVAEMEYDEAFDHVGQLKWTMIAICLVVMCIVFFIALLVSGRIVRPVEVMRIAMARIAENSKFSERVTVNSDNEIGQSACSLNAMLDSVEASISATNRVVEAMSNGDFKQRIDTEVNGDLLTLKEGVNSSAEAMEGAITEVNHVVTAIAHGDFNQRIDLDLHGDLDSLKNGVNSSADTIASAMNDLGELMDSMSQGNFKHRASTDLVGEYARFASRADSAMSVVDGALYEIDSVMAEVAQGGIDARVTADLPGQLSVIKTNLNNSLGAISSVFTETEKVLSGLADGDLHISIETDFPGRFNTLKTNTNATVDKLTEVVFEIQQSSDSVRSSAEDIAQGNSNLSQRTEQQAANLEETAASMDEITATVQHTATNANRANSLATEAKQQASRGGSVVNEAVEAMGEINNASNKIAEIISVIDEIAFQTNLLALNASVEAARAGEQGRGFAVVASEVRNLAGRSATAAKEIKELIEDSVQKVQAGSQLVSKSGETLDEIISHVENVTNIVGEITTAADEQSIGISEVHKAVESLQLLTQQNTAMVEEAAAASEELGGQARGLSDLMRFFNTKNGGSAPSVNRAPSPAPAKASRPAAPSQNLAPSQEFESDDWEEF